MDTSVDKCRKCPVDAVTQKVCNAPNGVCTISNAGQSSTASCTCENGLAEKLVGKKRQRLQKLASRIVMATVSAQTAYAFVAPVLWRLL